MNGSRLTKQRQAIMDVLRATDTHPDASWVYQQVRMDLPHISLGTVYRNLTWLAAEGLVHEIRIAGRASHWDGRAEKHSHVICIACGKVVDVNLQLLPDGSYARVIEATGFRLIGQYLELEGLCPDCQAREAHAAQVGPRALSKSAHLSS